MAPTWTQIHDSLPEDDVRSIRKGKYWVEVHGDEDIVSFNQLVDRLRDMVSTARCKVVSSLLTRDPVHQVVSEWYYFYQGHNADEMSSNGWREEWVTDMWSYVSTHPENELRWLTADMGRWVDNPSTFSSYAHRVWGKAARPGVDWNPAAGQIHFEQPLEADCAAASQLMEEQMPKIDIVGSMDTPQEFGAWWLALGRAAGFDASATERDDEATNVNDEDNPGKLLPHAKLLELQKLNHCSKRVHNISKMFFQRIVRNEDAEAAEHLAASGFAAQVGHEMETATEAAEAASRASAGASEMAHAAAARGAAGSARP